MLAAAGVSPVRLHDARHTCATLMHLEGVPIAVIAAYSAMPPPRLRWRPTRIRRIPRSPTPHRVWHASSRIKAHSPRPCSARGAVRRPCDARQHQCRLDQLRFSGARFDSMGSNARAGRGCAEFGVVCDNLWQFRIRRSASQRHTPSNLVVAGTGFEPVKLSRRIYSPLLSPFGDASCVGCQIKRQLRGLVLLATESCCQYYCGRSADGGPYPAPLPYGSGGTRTRAVGRR